MRVWLALPLLLLLPLAEAQDLAAAEPKTLYLHVINVQDMPINTQVPDPAYEDDVSWGTAAVDAPCLGSAMPGFDQGFNTWRAYGTPSLVEYGLLSADGTPRTHPERGIAIDVSIDDSQPFTLYWYVLAATPVGGVTGTTWAPAVAPQVQISATLRTGDSISSDDSAYDSGAMLAQGAVTATLAGNQVLGAGDNQVRVVGQRHDAWLYEFAIPMTVTDPVIPMATGYNLRIDMATANDACTGLMPPTLAVHTSAEARPRMVFAADTGLAFQDVTPQWLGDDLVVEAGAMTAWGSYDVDAASLRASVSGTMSFDLPIERVVREYHSHTLSANPLVATWRWGNASVAPPGHYEVTITAADLQGTTLATTTLGIDVAPTQASPAVPAPIFLAALAALAIALRRR
ncbi:MAG: hypothetical protein AABY18_02170 [Candidatus Thermoplasmatota archaeon]